MLFTPVVTQNTSCELCPRACHADRTTTERGACKNDYRMRIGKIMLHEWEEPCIAQGAGAGAIFFGGCPLACVYCQNQKLSHFGAGAYRTLEELTDAMLSLQEQGASCIDLVSATPFAYEVIMALRAAKERGLILPIVWNTSGYESIATLRMLEGLVDVYLPDLKTLSATRAKRYMNAPDYPKIAKAALAEMLRQTGAPQFNGQGLLLRGTLVRHLVLPKALTDTRRVLEYLAGFGDEIIVSLMSQYTPPELLDEEQFPELAAPLAESTYRRAVRYAETLGIARLYTQDPSSAVNSYVPEWDYPVNAFDLLLKFAQAREAQIKEIKEKEEK